MREKIKDPVRLMHIHKAISKIETFMENKGLKDLEGESVLFYAVVKNLEIIGEASYKLTKEFKETYPEVVWLDLEKLRHVLVHGYYTINPEIVYEIIMQDLPEIKNTLPK